MGYLIYRFNCALNQYQKTQATTVDDFVKSRESLENVIPSRIGVRDDGQAGIQ